MKIESFNDFISKDFYIPLNKKILMVSGKDHLKFLNGISTNLNGNINESTRNLILNNKGKILFDIIFYRVEQETSLILVSDNEVDELVDYVNKYKLSYRVEIKKLKENCIISKEQNKRSVFSFNSPNIGEEDLIINILDNDYKDSEDDIVKYNFWKASNGIPSYPNEINSNRIPIELNLWFPLNFTKGCYIGQEIIARIRYKGNVKRNLAVIRSEQAINPDAEIFIKGKIVGKITSSFSLNDKFVSLGLINREYNSEGKEIEIENQKCLVSDNIFKKINEKIVEL
ncbi:MAG: hypothetical protein CBC86_0003530 [Deltaproteobacteria bacterium TMED126]|jgi:folate-binding protein YgfZ|nr:hypothetical protein [Candidatus Dadabacteria bacterium]NSW97364.1 hypothetical protein [Deltaproteobacteria bacterium TMED126]NSW97663.1 hypothetical protein [Deltaproteobacteria bacterium TMED126]|tara:strand:+ start:25192 stop:26046 length:855 start_codon:yes stop_codon:yes gene_type:complete